MLEGWIAEQYRDLQERGILPKQGSNTDEKSTSDTGSDCLPDLPAVVAGDHVLGG